MRARAACAVHIDRVAGIGLLLLLAAGAGRTEGSPGYYLEEELVKVIASGRPTLERSRTWLAAGRLRKEQGEKGTVTIVRDDRREVWVIDPSHRTYFRLGKDSLERMSQLGTAALIGTEDPASWLRVTGNKRRIGEWDCYEVRADDRPMPGARISLWLSTAVPIDRALRDAYGSGTLAGSSPAGRLLAGLRDLEGYPVEVQLVARLGDQILELTQTLKKVEKTQVDDARFLPPADFREVASPLAAPAAAASPPGSSPRP